MPLAWACFFVCGQISTTSSSSSVAAAPTTTMSSALSTWNKRADSIHHPLIKWQGNWVSCAFAARVCARTFTVNANTRTLDTIERPEMDGYVFIYACSNRPPPGDAPVLSKAPLLSHEIGFYWFLTMPKWLSIADKMVYVHLASHTYWHPHRLHSPLIRA